MKTYATKRRGISSGRPHSQLGADSNFSYRPGDHGKIHGRFDTKWIQQDVLSNELRLGTSDVQSVADLDNSFELVRNIKLAQPRKAISALFPFRG
jgi:hypothetical protein